MSIAGWRAARRLAVSLAALTCLDSASAWAQAGAEPDPLLQARRSIEAGRPAEALASLSRVDRADPAVDVLRGVAHYHAGQFQQAIDTLQPLASRLAPDSSDAGEVVQVLGLALFFSGRYADAVPWLERTRDAAPRHVEVNRVLGISYIHVQRPEAARDAFARVFDVSASSAAASVIAAQMMVRYEMEAQAAAELKRALALDPRIPRAHYLLAQQAVFRGQLDEGIALVRRELDVNPSDAMALYLLGDALGRQQKWDESVEALRRSLLINPYYSGPMILLGRAYLRTGHPATAEEVLRKAIEFDPNNRAAHQLLGQALQKLGRADEAARVLALADSLPEQRE
jgi:tetratricopeptide (TPR) repeat protein